MTGARTNVVPLASNEAGSVEIATWAELEAAEKIDSSVGQAALVLARLLDDSASGDTGSSKAQVAKELKALMAEALKGAALAADPLDELRARREARRRGA